MEGLKGIHIHVIRINEKVIFYFIFMPCHREHIAAERCQNMRECVKRILDGTMNFLQAST